MTLLIHNTHAIEDIFILYKHNDKKVDLPEVGIEPTRPCGHQILSLACLPIPSLRRDAIYIHLSLIMQENLSNQLLEEHHGSYSNSRNSRDSIG